MHPLQLVFFMYSAPDELMHGDFHVLFHRKGVGGTWQLASSTYEHGVPVTHQVESTTADELGFRRIVTDAIGKGLRQVYVPAADLAEIDYFHERWLGNVVGDTSQLTTVVTLPSELVVS